MRWRLTDSGLVLEDAQHWQRQAAGKALARFRDSGHTKAEKTGSDLLANLEGGTLAVDHIRALSRWCHTGESYSSGRSDAQDASRALFNDLVLPKFEIGGRSFNKDLVMSRLDEFIVRVNAV